MQLDQSLQGGTPTQAPQAVPMQNQQPGFMPGQAPQQPQVVAQPEQVVQTPNPVATPVTPQQSSEVAQVQNPANGGTGKKILLVEDEVPLLKALSSKFKQENFIVFEAADGKLGMELAQANMPDIVIADIVMPNMDGFNMIKAIRESDWGKEMEIILLTNLNNSQDVATAMTYGVEDYFVKSDMKLMDIVLKVKEKLGIS